MDITAKRMMSIAPATANTELNPSSGSRQNLVVAGVANCCRSRLAIISQDFFTVIIRSGNQFLRGISSSKKGR